METVDLGERRHLCLLFLFHCFFFHHTDAVQVSPVLGIAQFKKELGKSLQWPAIARDSPYLGIVLSH